MSEPKIMNKENIPSFDKMLKPILISLKELGGSATVDDIDKKVINIMQISDELCDIPHGLTNRSEISYRCAWARTYLKKYGLIDNTIRGKWALTDKFNGNIEEIDATLITRAVRHTNLDAFNNAELSNLESHVAFEKYVISALTEYLSHQGKTLETTSSYLNDFDFDAILPQGIDEISDKTYVIIKYTKSNKSSYFRTVEQNCNNLTNLSEQSHILFILGTVLSDNTKKSMIKMACSYARTRVTIWDYNDLVDRASLESGYIEYLTNPKKALAVDAISIRQNEHERENTKLNLIEKLKVAYSKEEVTLFLGAGVSIAAGVPLWSELINKLLIQMIANKSEGKKLNRNEINILNKLAYSNKEDSPLTQVRYIRTAFEQPDYYRLVHRVLYENKLTLNTDLLNSIIDLCTPRRNHVGVRSVVTYNFDNLLERKLKSKAIDYNVVYRESDISSYDCLNVYHVHGYLPTQIEEVIDNDMNLIFSEEDYHRVYRDAYCWSNITQLNAFRDNTCFFIGCSLTDPNLRRLLDVASRQGESPRHFAIMKRNNVAFGQNDIEQSLISIYESIDTNIRESYFRSIGINIIWVNRFEEIPDILRTIRN